MRYNWIYSQCMRYNWIYSECMIYNWIYSECMRYNWIYSECMRDVFCNQNGVKGTQRRCKILSSFIPSIPSSQSLLNLKLSAPCIIVSNLILWLRSSLIACSLFFNSNYKMIMDLLEDRESQKGLKLGKRLGYC